jgi:ankyrin repeat protein
VLFRSATLEDRFLAACGAADRAAAEALAAEHPGLVAGLPRDDHRFLPHKARANDYAAVELMLDLGFDPAATGPDNGDALHWAAFLGNAEMVRLLLRQGAPPNVRDASYGSTALGWCLHGATKGWERERGDFATTARYLLEAGERPDPGNPPTGRADLDAVLGAAPDPQA